MPIVAGPGCRNASVFAVLVGERHLLHSAPGIPPPDPTLAASNGAEAAFRTIKVLA
jgi:hypothetical protein